MTSAPGSPTASSICWVTPTEPHPTATCSGGTLKRSAMAWVRASARLSGYRLTDRASAAMTSTTEGSGGCGDSLDESLCDVPAELTGVRPGL